MSKDNKYNEIFYKNLGPYDDLFTIGKINIFIIFNYIKIFFYLIFEIC